MEEAGRFKEMCKMALYRDVQIWTWFELMIQHERPIYRQRHCKANRSMLYNIDDTDHLEG